MDLLDVFLFFTSYAAGLFCGWWITKDDQKEWRAKTATTMSLAYWHLRKIEKMIEQKKEDANKETQNGGA